MGHDLAGIFSGFLGLIPITLAQSLILSFVALAIMVPFRLLNFQDLTSEGAFPLGGAVCAVALAGGLNPWLALLLGAAAGFVAGCCTAAIHLRFKIHSLLAGILVTTMLYSIDLRIMGRPNLSVFGAPSVYDALPAISDPSGAKIAIAGGCVLIVLVLLELFLKTELGTAMRAVGANPDMAEAQGIAVARATLVGVGAAAAFAALAGALMVQSQGFADVNMGLGVLINGLASLMIGEALVGRRSVTRQLLAPVVGSIAYYQLVSLCLAAGMPPPDLKLATGVFVMLMLALPALKRGSARAAAPG